MAKPLQNHSPANFLDKSGTPNGLVPVQEPSSSCFGKTRSFELIRSQQMQSPPFEKQLERPR